MCNNILWDETVNPKKIPEVGVGWKVFYKGADKYYPAFGYASYKKDSEGWIQWNTPDTKKGFCFFINKEDAERLKEDLAQDRCFVLKIQYEQGVQERTQRCIISDDDEWRMAICKRFRILEEECTNSAN